MGLLEGKNAIITGSARGIGRATAELFAANGANVLINDLDADAAEQASSEIDGPTAVFACDLTETDAADRLVEAAVEAVEAVDSALGRVVAAVLATGGACLVTADHGNVEQMSDHMTGQPHTAHTSEFVPLVYIGPKTVSLQAEGGVLSDVAPTLLALMDLAQPAEMTGSSLLIEAERQTASA